MTSDDPEIYTLLVLSSIPKPASHNPFPVLLGYSGRTDAQHARGAAKHTMYTVVDWSVLNNVGNPQHPKATISAKQTSRGTFLTHAKLETGIGKSPRTTHVLRLCRSVLVLVREGV